MPNRSRFPRTRGGARRSTSWSAGPRGVTGTISASEVSIFGTGTQATVDGLTLVRTRGEILLSLDSGTAIDDGYQFAFGLCIVTENAFNAGVASVPTPLTDIAWDGWLFHTQGNLKIASTTIENGLGTTNARIPIDSKAMRKFKNTDVMVGVLEVVETTTANMRAALESRLLLKLP